MKRLFGGVVFNIKENLGSMGGWSVMAEVEAADEIQRWPNEEIVSSWIGIPVTAACGGDDDLREGIYVKRMEMKTTLFVKEIREFLRTRGHRGNRRLRLIDISGSPWSGYDYELVEQERREEAAVTDDGRHVNVIWATVRSIAKSRTIRVAERSYAPAFELADIEAAWV